MVAKNIKLITALIILLSAVSACSSIKTKNISNKNTLNIEETLPVEEASSKIEIKSSDQNISAEKQIKTDMKTHSEINALEITEKESEIKATKNIISSTEKTQDLEKFDVPRTYTEEIMSFSSSRYSENKTTREVKVTLIPERNNEFLSENSTPEILKDCANNDEQKILNREISGGEIENTCEIEDETENVEEMAISSSDEESTIPLPTVDNAFSRDLSLEELEQTEETVVSHVEEKIKPKYDFPIVRNSRVNKIIHHYTQKRKKVLELGMKRSGKYLDIFRKILKEEGVPQDLVYLVAIESNFNSKARSHANAMGLWQFIKPTAKHYDLVCNRWVDERMEPLKATRAAAKYLRYLYERFQSWELALAGYNAGEGRVYRSIVRNKKRGKKTDFWSLRLPRETKNYVPAFMAMVIIYKNPDEFGLNHVQPNPPMEEELLTISSSYSLQEVAKRSEISLKKLVDINPFLYRGVPPLHQSKYQIYLPKDNQERLAASLDKDPKPFINWKPLYGKFLDNSSYITQLLSKYGNKTWIRVRKGDNLWNLARKNHTTVSRLCKWNGLKQNSILRINQKLKLYQPTLQVFAKATERHSSRSYSKPTGKQYKIRVKAGDTLSEIAQKHKVSVNSLLSWNNLKKPSDLKANQYLVLYGKKNVSRIKKEGDVHVITVQHGDTLWDLAKTYNTSVKKLIAVNDLHSKDTLHLNQKLIIPRTSSNISKDS